MEKKIEDYLHLLMGCECKVNAVDEKLILTGVSYDDTQRTHWGYFENTELGYAPAKEIKPILRPLSDMTEEEKKEIEKIETEGYMVDAGIEHNIWTPKEFLFLLSKSFDLFGLIESGLALDKTNLSPTTNL